MDHEDKNIGDENSDLKTGRHEWQPIETAPRDDGPAFLVWCPVNMSGNIYHVFRYTNDERFRVYASGGRLLYETATHWMPLPDPPCLSDSDQSINGPAEPDHCHWQSRDLGMCIKVWDTGCGDVRERLPDEKCPTCGKRVWLTGFDAWWEARKSYHP